VNTETGCCEIAAQQHSVRGGIVAHRLKPTAAPAVERPDRGCRLIQRQRVGEARGHVIVLQCQAAIPSTSTNAAPIIRSDRAGRTMKRRRYRTSKGVRKSNPPNKNLYYDAEWQRQDAEGEQRAKWRFPDSAGRVAVHAAITGAAAGSSSNAATPEGEHCQPSAMQHARAVGQVHCQPTESALRTSGKRITDCPGQDRRDAKAC